MVGRECRTAERRSEGAGRGRPRLEVSGLSMESETAHGVGIADVSFTVAGGEILGLAGVAGKGHGDLLGTLAGGRLGAPAAGLRLNSTRAGRAGPPRRRALGDGGQGE